MSLTRAFLKGLGIEEDKAASIIEAHIETVNGLQTKYSEFEKKYNDLETKYNTVKADADRLPNVQKELDELKKDDFKARFEAEKSAHDALKDSVSRKEARAAREKAARTYYETKNIHGANLTIAMRGTDLDQLELDDEGRLADPAPLEELVNGDFKSLVSVPHRTVTSGAALAGKSEPTPTANDVMNRLLRGT